jgi:hypothetical protein
MPPVKHAQTLAKNGDDDTLTGLGSGAIRKKVN